MKQDERYEKLISCSGTGGFYVPFGRTTFYNGEDNEKNNTDIAIWELIDENLYTTGWFFANHDFAEKNKKNFILVGELFLDFYNESVEFCNINQNRNLSPNDKIRIEKLRDVLLSVYRILSSGTMKEKIGLLHDFAFECEMRCGCLNFQVFPVSGDDGISHEYIVPTRYGGLESAFFLEDLLALIKNPTIRIEKCIYCEKLYIRRKKGQKYCPECVQAKISEQLKKENKTEQCKLRQKIYSRLYVRDGSGNNWEYGSGINDSDSFSKAAMDYKHSHTAEQYLAWLKEIDRITK